MKPQLLAVVTASIIAIPLSISVKAESLSDLNQLLSTKQCSQCDLSNAGLVQANLTGADLTQANLVGANLSQANLTGVNLRGANLTGTSLHGANLTGANLTGANLTGTDLGNAFLGNANLSEVDLDAANLEGVKGLSATAASAEQFHRWGVKESERGNYKGAIANYKKAISIDSELAPAYLGLAIVQFNFDRRQEAMANTVTAKELFKQQEHKLGFQTAKNFQQRMTLVEEAEANVAERQQGAGKVGKFMGSVGSLLLQFLL